MEQQQNTGLTFLGKLVSFLLILGLIGIGAYVIVKKGFKTPGGGGTGDTAQQTSTDAGSAVTQKPGETALASTLPGRPATARAANPSILPVPSFRK